MNRRDFLHLTASVAAIGAGCSTRKRKPTSADTGACPQTSDNIEGPFYREELPARDMLDLYSDEGVAVHLEGRVLDSDCLPVSGAVIDFWHANPDGAYDLDSAEKEYYGRVTADADGRWSLQTLLPGLYRNGSQLRPAHIHVKIWIDGAERLTTQLYFRGDPHIPDDPFVRDDLIMDYTEQDGAIFASFDFTLG